MRKPPVFLALDVNSPSQALQLVQRIHPYIFGCKIGPRLFFKCEKDFIKTLKGFGKVFLDFKFYDIPSSTVEAVRSAFHLGADYVTVHASAGQRTLEELARLEGELNKMRKFRILCVTVLSSVSGDSLQRVKVLAEDVFRSGLTGLVCSPWEVESLRARHREAFLVTPGIRLKGDPSEDQARVMTPEEALKKGSSVVVMGRSVLKAGNPLEVCQKFAKSLSQFSVSVE